MLGGGGNKKKKKKQKSAGNKKKNKKPTAQLELKNKKFGKKALLYNKARVYKVLKVEEI